MDTLVLEDGSPFELDKVYSITTTAFLSLGKDGFDAFVDPCVETVEEDHDMEMTVQQLLHFFLRNFARTPAEMERLKATKFHPIFMRRLEMMNTTMDNKCSETGYINICPKVEGRVVNIGEPMTHND